MLFLPFTFPGRKEMAKSQQRTEGELTEPKDSPASGKKSGGAFSRGLINLVSQVRDMFAGPPTDIQDCLDAFFDPSELKGGIFSTHSERDCDSGIEISSFFTSMAACSLSQ